MGNEWKLIKDLEADNLALSNAAKNGYSQMERQRSEFKRVLGKLKSSNTKLESDNKFLKQMVLKANHLTACELGQLLRQLFLGKNEKYHQRYSGVCVSEDSYSRS